MEKSLYARRAGRDMRLPASVILLAGLGWFIYRSGQQNKELTELKAAKCTIAGEGTILPTVFYKRSLTNRK